MKKYTDNELLELLDVWQEKADGDCHSAIENVSEITKVSRKRLYNLYDNDNRQPQ